MVTEGNSAPTGVSSRGRVLHKPARTRPQSAFRAIAAWNDDSPKLALAIRGIEHCYNVDTGLLPTPKSINQALTGKRASDWLKSIMSEWQGLWDLGTFEHVKYDDLPLKTKVMHLLWQFKVKPDKLKSRCCINGKQEAESEYDDIFAPV